MAAAVRLAQKLDKGVIVTIVCDRGDRYLSSNVFAKKFDKKDIPTTSNTTTVNGNWLK